MFYIGWPFDYRVIGLIATAVGFIGILLRMKANCKPSVRHIPAAYLVIALAGIITGLFYATVIGPFILFFPKI